jgi:hypothetical protein
MDNILEKEKHYFIKNYKGDFNGALFVSIIIILYPIAKIFIPPFFNQGRNDVFSISNIFYLFIFIGAFTFGISLIFILIKGINSNIIVKWVATILLYLFWIIMLFFSVVLFNLGSSLSDLRFN